MSEYTTIQPAQQIPYGYCQCGCGRKAPIATYTDNSHQIVKGKPTRFCLGHGRRRPLPGQFWKKVKVGKKDECWLWQACKDRAGYGALTWNRKVLKAHRVAYELAFGKIPPGLHVCHKCDNPACVNPNHLFLGTPADNMRDSASKGRNFRPIGSLSPSAKLNEAKVIDIRRQYRHGVPRKQLATKYGVSISAITDATLRRTWRHI